MSIKGRHRLLGCFQNRNKDLVQTDSFVLTRVSKPVSQLNFLIMRNELSAVISYAQSPLTLSVFLSPEHPRRDRAGQCKRCRAARYDKNTAQNDLTGRHFSRIQLINQSSQFELPLFVLSSITASDMYSSCIRPMSPFCGVSESFLMPCPVADVVVSVVESEYPLWVLSVS